MALYGISSPGNAITAGSGNDTILFESSSATAVVSANTILGLDGNDVIYLGAQGATATGSSIAPNITFNIVLSGTTTGINDGVLTGDYTLSGQLQASALLSTGTAVPVVGVAVSGTDRISGILTGGEVQIAGIITSERAARLINNSQIAGNAGQDSIYLGDNFTTVTSTTIQGGAGNDFIGNWVYANNVAVSALAGTGLANNTLTASTIQNTFIEGGGGNDTVDLTLSAGTFPANTIQGSQGDDLISIIATAGTVISGAQILVGGGNDTISGDIDALDASTIAGGGGNDAIQISADNGMTANLIAGDTFGTAATWDGNDTITADITGVFSGNTIQAGGGNDTLVLLGATDGGSNSIQLNAGNDVMTGQAISASSIFAGAGNDDIVITADILDAHIVLGGGADQITMSAGYGAEANDLSGTTIYGGAGADTFFSGNLLTGGSTLGARIHWASAGDSTISAMDTIAVTAGTAQVFNLTYDPASLSRGNTNASTGNGFSATNGVVIFTSTIDNNVTSRVNLLDAGLTTTGNVVTFADGGGVLYTFVQGGATDLVARVGADSDIEAAMTGITLTLSGENNSDIVLTVN